MKVAILGNTGMLGHIVQDVLKKNISFSVNGFGRESIDLVPSTLNKIGTKLSALLGFDTDYVINCLGATKPMFDKATDLSTPLYVNAIFPHQLAQWGELSKTKVIHVTTDCVYDGCIGRYDERAPSSALDHYGKSKSLGEPDNCMVIRTSIIGPEFGDRKRHFLSWVKSMANQSTKGFTNHLWNGITTLEFARILSDIISFDMYEGGTHHVYSTDITKHEMVKVISEVYGLDIQLEEHKTKYSCDRRLRTINSFNWSVAPKPYDEMIKDMFWYEVKNVVKESSI
jgi:dTDP-4-dehydrorhamnose reductase